MNTRQQLERLRKQLALLKKGIASPQVSRLVRLAQVIVEAPDAKLSCKECRDALPSYVDAEIAGEDTSALFPAVKQHLDLCHGCATEYVDLLEISLLETEGTLPIPDSYPSPDLSFLPTSVPAFEIARTFILQAAERAVTVLSPRTLGELTIVSEVFFAKVSSLSESIAFAHHPEFALAFGGETPKSLRVLAAAFSATVEIITNLSTQEIVEQTRQDRASSHIWDRAWQEAKEAGLSSSEAEMFATEYLKLANANVNTLCSLVEETTR